MEEREYSNLAVHEIKNKLNHYMSQGYDWMEDMKSSSGPIVYKNKSDISEVDSEKDSVTEIRMLWKTLVDKVYNEKRD
ncbi:hypothetical protein GW932_04790 [archaeon]|nr:hypothetical protein [archaeon]